MVWCGSDLAALEHVQEIILLRISLGESPSQPSLPQRVRTVKEEICTRVRAPPW